MKILIVEDDQGTAALLKQALTAQHYLVDLAINGEAGLELAEGFIYDLILLDVMLPKLDGLQVCRQLRAHSDRTPILLLTVQDSSSSKVIGLDAGADDYVVKPFDTNELLARIRALIRRESSALSSVIQLGNLRLDATDCKVTWNGNLLHLTAKEYALLELLLQNTHRIFSQSSLLDHLWSSEEPPQENTVRVHMKALRQKLNQAGADGLIETVYGLGYRVNLGKPEVEKAAATRSQPAAIALTTVSQPQPQTSPLTVLWERFKHKYSDRITVLEQAITALLEGRLTEELGQQAQQEAHTLIGSLGSFGFAEASRLSREIEQIFRASVRQSQAGRLSQLVVALRQSLEQSPALKLPAPQPPIKQQPRLLIVDGDRELAEQLIAEATLWGIQAEVAASLTEVRAAIAQSARYANARTPPTVVLLDLCFSNSVEGLELLAELRTTHPTLPVLVFAAQEDFANRVKVARLGGQIFLSKPVSPPTVLAAVTQVLQQSEVTEAKILVVDDDPRMLDILRTLLEPWGFKPTLLSDPQQFWTTLEQSNPDLLILDVEMPELSGIDLCQVVRNDPRWSELPVLFLSAHTDAETVNQVFTVGADDYVSKPILGPELIARVLNRLERMQILHKLATTDVLTGVANRYKSTQELTRLLSLAKRQGQPLCFAILDLDHFKQVNDQHGHNAGDQVLSQFGALLRQTFRREDVVARWGGDEFVVGMYGATREQVRDRLTALLKSIHQQEFTGASGEAWVSFSGGIAEYPENGTDLQALYRSADAALYQAKAAGRNRVFSS